MACLIVIVRMLVIAITVIMRALASLLRLAYTKQKKIEKALDHCEKASDPVNQSSGLGCKV